MKKVFIACFFAILMLMVPFAAVSQTSNIKNVSTVNLEEDPQIFITNEQYDDLNDFINANYEGEDKDEAEEIRDRIITEIVVEDYIQVDMIELEAAVREYGLQPIPVNLLNNVQNKEELEDLIEEYWSLEDLFEILVDKIIELIKDRLGWVYELFDRSITLVINGLNLVRGFIEQVGFLLAFSAATIFNYILLTAKQGVFSGLLANLFQGNGAEFINQFLALTGYLAGEFKTLVQDLKDLVTGPIKTYLQQIIDFLNWLSGDPKPWEAPIYIHGFLINLYPFVIPSGTISCRGDETTTHNRMFSLNVDPNPEYGESYPSGMYYGIHDCTITLSKDGEVLKESLPILSYAFSGGEIEWAFIVIMSRSKAADFRTVLMEKFNNLLGRMYIPFLNFFRQINRIDILSV